MRCPEARAGRAGHVEQHSERKNGSFYKMNHQRGIQDKGCCEPEAPTELSTRRQFSPSVWWRPNSRPWGPHTIQNLLFHEEEGPLLHLQGCGPPWPAVSATGDRPEVQALPGDPCSRHLFGCSPYIEFLLWDMWQPVAALTHPRRPVSSRQSAPQLPPPGSCTVALPFSAQKRALWILSAGGTRVPYSPSQQCRCWELRPDTATELELPEVKPQNKPGLDLEGPRSSYLKHLKSSPLQNRPLEETLSHHMPAYLRHKMAAGIPPNWQVANNKFQEFF